MKKVNWKVYGEALDATLLAVLEALPPQAVKLTASASRTMPARIWFLIFIG